MKMALQYSSELCRSVFYLALMATFTNQTRIAAMLRQRNTALMRKFTKWGHTLLLYRHSQLGERLTEYEQALATLTRLEDLDSDLQASEATLSPESEVDKEAQEALITELEGKLISYYTLLEHFHNVQSLPRPDKFDLATFKGMLEYDQSIDTSKGLWSEEDDLVHLFPKKSQPLDKLSGFLLGWILAHREDPRVRTVIEHLPTFILRRLVPPGHEIDDKTIPLALSRETISECISWLAIFVAPTINVAPMFALYAVPSIWARLVIVWVFSIMLGATTHLLSSGHNIAFVFSITAAFCAVLVVFVGSAPS
ncbi:hypothetical protein BGW36DRAFT_71547 [Talaromyces proteolyticus]|uniref:DUF6594 domain-containing protein n=1 Tax=Talaromyces proteolyticus TaxID=1131652 RepID=A0AAD4KEW0_9EURO|nr:uncharacterized protein BGW36DRAFT_71547 [Talaromyces proteolyticus]KAH8689472.1 hypothetical protein BGW36DRAFT_71547 [Talaromyces proteolyticus]